MPRKRSERSRWATIYTITSSAAHTDAGTRAAHAIAQHDQLRAIVDAFTKVGRAVRIEPGKHGSAIEVKARRS